jgi:hypothetical protein
MLLPYCFATICSRLNASTSLLRYNLFSLSHSQSFVELNDVLSGLLLMCDCWLLMASRMYVVRRNMKECMHSQLVTLNSTPSRREIFSSIMKRGFNKILSGTGKWEPLKYGETRNPQQQ